MKNYYERYIVCEKCKKSDRQTSLQTTFDKVGELLDNVFRTDFLRNHNKCNSSIYYTDWKEGKYNFE